MDLFKTIPNNLEGLEEAAEQLLDGRLLEDVKERILHARICNEYRVQIKQRRGQSEQIKRELSQKYFNTPNRIKTIEYIIYR